MELQNKRPTQILIVSKQSHQCSGELNTNFWTKELKLSLVGTKSDSNASAGIIRVKIFTKCGQNSKRCILCNKVLLQHCWYVAVAVDSVVNWCHFELLSSFLEMRMPPSIPRYNQLERSASGGIKKRKTRFCYQIVLQKHIKNLFMVQLRGDWGAKF